MLKTLFEAKRSTKRAVSLLYDTSAITLAIYCAICLRLGSFTFEITSKELVSLAVTIIVSIAVFVRLGLYRAILRYMTLPAVATIVTGVCISGLALAASSFFSRSAIPRSVPLIYISTALLFIGTPRFFIRSIVSLLYKDKSSSKESVIIYGAGYTGHQLALSLTTTPFKPVAFIDDNPKLKGSIVAGLKVYRPKHLMQLVKEHSAKKVLLALGNASRSERMAVIKKLEPLTISVQTIPDLNDVLTGKAKIDDIKDVEIDDLLGRDPIAPNEELLHACIKDKVVMVTGAGGSIGSELCRQILRQQPTHLILLELNEYGLYKIEQELQKTLKAYDSKTELVPLLGSVQNQPRLESIMSTYSVQTIYHAAAYKHVPLVEHNIIEGVQNNVFGTWHCAEAAIKVGVESFVLISTDKAVRPTNIMGASKRVAELVLQGLSEHQTSTRFTMVRFGNVLGSSGSVIPLFREQIKQGGPVTVTHPDITRYFMTISEASELVIQAGSMGKGGDVFVLDMGEPVKIIDLAKRMIRLSGLEIKDDKKPKGDIEVQFNGLRPGEKLYEELLIGENVNGTHHKLIMRAEEISLNWQKTYDLLDELGRHCNNLQTSKIKELLLKAPLGYQTETEIKDWVYLKNQDISGLRLVKS